MQGEHSGRIGVRDGGQGNCHQRQPVGNHLRLDQAQQIHVRPLVRFDGTGKTNREQHPHFATTSSTRVASKHLRWVLALAHVNLQSQLDSAVADWRLKIINVNKRLIYSGRNVSGNGDGSTRREKLML